jgi:predicted nuclease of predicted toxin-antitoxin system
VFFAIDENVDVKVGELLLARGHQVEFVRDWLGQGTKDQAVAFAADRQQAIVVTHDKDFKALAQRAPNGSRAQYKALGRISLRCREARARSRLTQLIDFIEYDFDRSRKLGDRRVIVSITESTIVFSR